MPKENLKDSRIQKNVEKRQKPLLKEQAKSEKKKEELQSQMLELKKQLAELNLSVTSEEGKLLKIEMKKEASKNFAFRDAFVELIQELNKSCVSVSEFDADLNGIRANLTSIILSDKEGSPLIPETLTFTTQEGIKVKVKEVFEEILETLARCQELSKMSSEQIAKSLLPQKKSANALVKEQLGANLKKLQKIGDETSLPLQQSLKDLEDLSAEARVLIQAISSIPSKISKEIPNALLSDVVLTELGFEGNNGIFFKPANSKETHVIINPKEFLSKVNPGSIVKGSTKGEIMYFKVNNESLNNLSVAVSEQSSKNLGTDWDDVKSKALMASGLGASTAGASGFIAGLVTIFYQWSTSKSTQSPVPEDAWSIIGSNAGEWALYTAIAVVAGYGLYHTVPATYEGIKNMKKSLESQFCIRDAFKKSTSNPIEILEIVTNKS